MAPTQVYGWGDLANVYEEKEQAMSPLEKMYFNGEMLEKYEPCVDVLQKLIDAEGDDENAWNTFEEHFEHFLDFSWCSNWDGKKYDIVLYGVSGYTGYLTMQYMKRVSLKRNPEAFTFAFAGRTLSKVAEKREINFAGTPQEDTPILQAAYDDIVSMVDLAKSAYVIINVAGPYSLAQGEVLVDACCHVGCHYCDVSGELPWTLRVLELDAHAKQGGAVISPSAAVAGAYSDVLVYLAAKKAKTDFGEELRRATAYNRGGGAGAGSSGGTLASRGAMSAAADEVRKKMADPYTLGGFIPEIDRNGVKEVQIENGTGRVTPKIRKEETDAVLSKVSIDPHLGVWRAPFVYAYFNTRILRRSNQLFADLENRPYGRSFNYQEFALLPPEALAQMEAAKVSTSTSKGVGGPSVSGEKEALEAMGKYYKQGEGPPLEELGDAWIAAMIYAMTTSGNVVFNAFCGADGYFETARCAVEFAMTMRFDYHKLPHKGGVLTATVAGQDCYAKRLIESGVKYKIGSATAGNLADAGAAGWFTEEELGPPGLPQA
eukprot:CAMPEP_0195088184 /NCGR_PEP_ID=MMETSP0448-20130528/27814_1 /TAXON_ID=66468 /ORGANISM="Heterocapsa triquestra, Strain CCMP 448" /LENGTH=544 /DNA_ID=CAMNT_0040121809 /DNA_START=102 /DNA_END=1736 /DNA_ORIENTATION=+